MREESWPECSWKFINLSRAAPTLFFGGVRVDVGTLAEHLEMSDQSAGMWGG